jgi:hypothetical protein
MAVREKQNCGLQDGSVLRGPNEGKPRNSFIPEDTGAVVEELAMSPVADLILVPIARVNRALTGGRWSHRFTQHCLSFVKLDMIVQSGCDRECHSRLCIGFANAVAYGHLSPFLSRYEFCPSIHI